MTVSEDAEFRRRCDGADEYFSANVSDDLHGYLLTADRRFRRKRSRDSLTQYVEPGIFDVTYDDDRVVVAASGIDPGDKLQRPRLASRGGFSDDKLFDRRVVEVDKIAGVGLVGHVSIPSQMSLSALRTSVRTIETTRSSR